VVRRDPRQCGVAQSRWRLEDLSEQCQWLNLETASGMSQRLQRLGIHYKRGRDYVHRPDAFYQAKVDEIKALKERMQTKYG
jgi:hypothetical protein